MRHLVYLEDDAAAWVDFTDRVAGGIGAIDLKASSEGHPIVGPPSTLVVDNRDGYWLTEPDRSGSLFAGGWESRRVQIRLERAPLTPLVLGTFRVKNEEGLAATRDGWASLKLEPLTEALKRGDASEVSFGRGWFPNLPWPLAIDRLRTPEDASALVLPSASIPYEDLHRAISSLGRPGDFQPDGWHDVRSKAVDISWNEVSAVHAAITLDGKIYEYADSVGRWDPVTVSFTLPTGWHALRIFWKRESTGIGVYWVLASNHDGIGYAGPRRLLKGASLRLYRHNNAAPVDISTDYSALIAPQLVRDIVNDRPSGAEGAVLYGSEYYGWDGYGSSSINDRREALLIPFAQLPFALESRDATIGGQADQLECFRLRIGGGWEFVPLNAYTPDDENRWVVDAIAGTVSEARFRDAELKAGAGYYVWMLRDSANSWTALPAASWRSPLTGLVHSIGQGPLFDLSFEHSGSATYNGKVYCAHAAWSAAAGWQIICRFIDGTTLFATVVATLGFHKLPTFVVCDITRPADVSGRRGAVIFGWIDYAPGNSAINRLSGTTGSVWTAASGIDVYPVTAAAPGAAVTFSPQGRTVVNFRERQLDVESRYFRGGANPHISGRWTPIAMGFKRRNETIAAERFTHYNAILSCIDRSELEPSLTGGNSAESERGGTSTYRLLYLHITILATSVTDPYPYATSITDTRGPGYDIQSKNPLPWMGFSRVLRGDAGDEGSWNTAEVVFGYNPADRGLYQFDASDTGLGKPRLLGLVPHSDLWLGMGNLAVGNEGGDVALPLVAGISCPVFPCSALEAWPMGLYQAWIYSGRHSGRIPLLDNKDRDKYQAICGAADLGDHLFAFTRAGVAELRPYPSSSTPPVLTLRGPTDYEEARRTNTLIVNSSQRSVYDVKPGEVSLTTIAAPESRFAATPTFSGLGIYPIELELRCILAGRPSDVVAAGSMDSWRAHTLWSWRLTGSRLKTTLRLPVLAGGSTLAVEDLQGISPADTVTLSLSDVDLRIDYLDAAAGTIVLESPLTQAYDAGAAVLIDPASQGQWSHALRYDTTLDRYVGIAEVTTAAVAGSRSIRVSSLEPFAQGTLIRIHPKGSGFASGASSPDYLDCYQVVRLHGVDDGYAYNTLDIEAIEGGGLLEQIAEGDAITAYLNLPPVGRSQRIGQSGILFGLVGQAGSPADDTEPPIAEGDTIRLSYPGLEAAKNQQNRVTVRDAESLARYGERKPRRRSENRYADHELTLLMASREVRREAWPRAALAIAGARFQDPALQDLLLTLELFDVVDVVDFELLRGFPSSRGRFLVFGHKYDQANDSVDLDLEELDVTSPGSRYSEIATAPARPDFQALGDDGEVLLTWDKPEHDDFDVMMVRWALGGFPKTPTDGMLLGEYPAGVYSTKHSSLANGTPYFYTAFTRTTAGKYSPWAWASAPPAPAPSPTPGLAVAAGDETLILTWTDPATSDFAGVMVRYALDGTAPATVADGTAAGFAAPGAQTLTLTGLANGHRYSLSLFALDGMGNAAAAVSIDGDPDFDPEDYVSVSANWKAHALRGIVADGGVVNALADAGPDGNDLAKYSDASRPTWDDSDADYNDLPVLVYDGANKTLHAASFNPFSPTAGGMLFIVGEIGTTGSSQTFVAKYDGTERLFYVRGGSIVIYEDYAGAAFASISVSASLPTGTPVLLEVVYLPNQIARAAIDGVHVADDDGDAPSTLGTGGTKPITLGSTYATGNSLVGRIAQVILCDVYDEAARRVIREKLRKKYGVFAGAVGTGSFNADFSEDFAVGGPSFNNDFSDDFEIAIP